MAQAGETLTHEYQLAELVRRLDGNVEGRVALHFHLSQLRPENRRPFHLRVARESLKPAVERYKGQMFVMHGGDLVLLLRDAPDQAMFELVDRLRYLFADDTLTEGPPGAEAGRLATLYNLADDYHSLRRTADGFERDARERSQQKTSSRDAPTREPLGPRHMPKLMGAIESAEISVLIRRQPICVLVPGAAPQPVLWETMIDLDELGRLLMPEVELTGNRWLRAALQEAMLRRLMVWLARKGIEATNEPISVDAMTSGLMSAEFLGFDMTMSPSTRKRVVFELQEMDLFSDMAALVFLREFLQDRGYRVCLDGLNHLTLPMIDRGRLGFDLLKFKWGPDFETDIRRERAEALRDAIAQAGEARVILYNCDSARAVDCGHRLGITLFQGSYVESMIKPAALKRAAVADARP